MFDTLGDEYDDASGTRTALNVQVTTPQLDLSKVVPETVSLEFRSSWQSTPQTAEVRLHFDATLWAL
jgi:hypothetical protein